MKRRRFFGNEGIGAGLDEKIANAFGGDDTAQTRRSFEQRDFKAERSFAAEFDETMSGGKSGDSAAHDDDAAIHAVNRRLRTFILYPRRLIGLTLS